MATPIQGNPAPLGRQSRGKRSERLAFHPMCAQSDECLAAAAGIEVRQSNPIVFEAASFHSDTLLSAPVRRLDSAQLRKRIVMVQFSESVCQPGLSQWPSRRTKTSLARPVETELLPSICVSTRKLLQTIATSPKC